jgi:glutathione synthase/RimK-type ligase-like ATP-grasp enzyme
MDVAKVHSMAESTLKRMIWVFPDRESRRGAAMWRKAFWNAYEQVAGEMGLEWISEPPEHIAFDSYDLYDPKVYVAGELVTPADTLFVTSLYSLPYQSMDVFNQYAVYSLLEQTGFYLPAPPYLSSIVNDKLATILYLKDCPAPPIPTIRIGTGRELGQKFYDPALAKLTYPAIVKPVGWCAGWGICLARDIEDLRGVLSLAQGGDTAMAVQPYLGDGTVDYRVFCVDGAPRLVQRRMPRPGGYVGNVGRGGLIDYAPMPAELEEPVAFVTKKVPIPYLTVDFLHDGERFWLSEIEPDGAVVCHDTNSEVAVRTQHGLIAERFAAYRRGHAAWLAQSP